MKNYKIRSQILLFGPPFAVSAFFPLKTDDFAARRRAFLPVNVGDVFTFAPAISPLSKFRKTLQKMHLKAARHILPYLMHTRTFSIVYLRQKTPIFCLFGSSDGNRAGGRKSHTDHRFAHATYIVA